MTDEFRLNKGTSLEFRFNWPNGAGGNANLNGFTAAAYDLHKSLDGRVDIAITDELTGQITGKVNWRDGIPLGRAAYFRVGVTAPDGARTTTNRLWLNVQ